MPAPKRAAKPAAAKSTPADQTPEQAKPDENAPVPVNLNGSELTQLARKVRADAKYDGKLTPTMLLDLEPLLYHPLERKYIETTAPTKGKPYESTGVRSVQVQIDRMNTVLGFQHWRVLYHYQSNGELCRCHALVGNDLQWARLDEKGELLPYTIIATEGLSDDGVREADVLMVREGWGGHNRGTARGDLYKGSETNALKRTLARCGPGAEVYRLDFDDDVNKSADPVYQDPSAKQQQRSAAAPQQQQQAPPDFDAQLKMLLGREDALQEQRVSAHKGLEVLGAPVRQMVREIEAADSAEKLQKLIDRINSAIDGAAEQDAADQAADQAAETGAGDEPA